MSDTPPAGWYPDPQDGARQRYWDGNAWTEHTADASPQAASGGQAASGASAMTTSSTSSTGSPDTWTWQSIVATIFCCNLLGVVGVLNAGRAEAALRAGDVAGAREHASKAKKWTLWSVGIALVLGLLYVAFMVAVAGSMNFSEFDSSGF